MMFVLRSAFWLGLIFALAPGEANDPRREAGARAAGAALQGAAAVAAKLPEEAARLCAKAPGECLHVAGATAPALAPAGRASARPNGPGGKDAGKDAGKATVASRAHQSKNAQKPREGRPEKARS
jgi:hypothetical protein